MSLKTKFEEAKQEQVFQFYDSLSGNEQASLNSQLSVIDPIEINEINKAAHDWKPSESDINQLPEESQSSTIGQDVKQIEKWRDVGLQAIKDGQVAVLLLAGGQGTRLGSSAPKGCYDISLPSHKSLFQLQGERILKLGKNIPWYVMTSGPTRAPTEKFFKENNYFGLSESNVIFFEQGTLPCVDFNGKIIMESKSKVSVALDGNGGVYRALDEGNILKDMEKRGIKHIHMYCVDNSLVKVADPVFIGFSVSHKVDIATKVVRKRNADEQVGLIACRNGHPSVIEYSDIGEELRNAKDSNGLLKLRAANIVNHYYSIDFLLKSPELAKKMPYHIAKKKIPFADASGATVKPEKPNGIKFEQFVFDIFAEIPLEKFGCLEVERSSEFSPVKNGPGSAEDCPETARNDLMSEGRTWLLNAGAKSAKPVEISPLVSYSGENLEKYKDQDVTVDYIN